MILVQYAARLNADKLKKMVHQMNGEAMQVAVRVFFLLSLQTITGLLSAALLPLTVEFSGSSAQSKATRERSLLCLLDALVTMIYAHPHHAAQGGLSGSSSSISAWLLRKCPTR